MYEASVQTIVFRQLGFRFTYTYRTISVVLYYCLPKEAQTVKHSKYLREKRAVQQSHDSNESLRTLLCKISFTLLLYIFETVANWLCSNGTAAFMRRCLPNLVASVVGTAVKSANTFPTNLTFLKSVLLLLVARHQYTVIILIGWQIQLAEKIQYLEFLFIQSFGRVLH